MTGSVSSGTAVHDNLGNALSTPSAQPAFVIGTEIFAWFIHMPGARLSHNQFMLSLIMSLRLTNRSKVPMMVFNLMRFMFCPQGKGIAESFHSG